MLPTVPRSPHGWGRVQSSLTRRPRDYCLPIGMGVRPLGRSLIEERACHQSRRPSPGLLRWRTTLPAESGTSFVYGCLSKLVEELRALEQVVAVVEREARHPGVQPQRSASDRGLGAARRTGSGRGHPHGSGPISTTTPPPRGPPLCAPSHSGSRRAARTISSHCSERPRGSSRSDARTPVRRPPCRC